jgi:hypothetical protein
MPLPRICKVSDNDFGGFNIIIDLDYYYSIEEISQYIKEKLVNSLKRINLNQLVYKATNKKFHIHDKTMADAIAMGPNDILYVCGHC